MRACPGVVLRPRLAKILDNSLHRTEISALSRRADQGLVDRLVRHLHTRHSDAMALGKSDDENGLFSAPFDMYMIDKNSRVAKVHIGPDLILEPIEFRQPSAKN